MAPLILFFFTKRQSQKEGVGHGAKASPLKYAIVSTFKPRKVLMVNFHKKSW